MRLRISIFSALALSDGRGIRTSRGFAAPQVTETDIVQGMAKKGIIVASRQVSMLCYHSGAMEHPVLEAFRRLSRCR